MADEVTVSVSLSVLKGRLSDTFAKNNRRFDMSGTDAIHMTQTIGTSAETLDFGDITTPGWICIVNLDEDNYISLRYGAGGSDLVEIKAQECQCFRLARASAPYLIADTAAVQIEYLLLED